MTLSPNDKQPLSDWRREQLGLKAEPTRRDGYDLVVVGGGYSDMERRFRRRAHGMQGRVDSGSPGARRQRQQRSAKLGDGQHSPRGKFPRIGEIIEEFADHATKSPGRAEEFGDDLKEAVVKAEKNIDLRDHHGQWFWESGFDKDAIGDSESIRDWNLRAVYGAFNAMKNRDGAEKHKSAILTCDVNATIRFPFAFQDSGKYDIRVCWLPHENRDRHARITQRGLRPQPKLKRRQSQAS